MVTLLWYHIALGSAEMRSTNGSFRGGTEHEQMVAVHVVRLVMGKENQKGCLIGLWYTKMENIISLSYNSPSVPICTTIDKCQQCKLYNLKTKLHLMQNSSVQTGDNKETNNIKCFSQVSGHHQLPIQFHFKSVDLVTCLHVCVYWNKNIFQVNKSPI